MILKYKKNFYLKKNHFFYKNLKKKKKTKKIKKWVPAIREIPNQKI